MTVGADRATTPDVDQRRTMIIEAFADTILPGEKRWPGDRAVAGAAPGPGAVAAGAIELLEQPGGGLAEALDALAMSLDEHATEYAGEYDLTLDEDVPPFVALSFADRTTLVAQLTSPDHPEREMWVPLAVFSTMAFDSAAHVHTLDAVADDHPGLLTIGYFRPDADGLWRFPHFTYGRALAPAHPSITAKGDPA